VKQNLLNLIVCPDCGNELVIDSDRKYLVCCGCSNKTILSDGIPQFTKPPGGLVPSEKEERSPDLGTSWRRANWQFLKSQIAKVESQALILDVGAGRGDFQEVFVDREQSYFALDVYPYPEVDIACDLSLSNPIRENSFDVIVLMNVLEHVYNGRDFLASLAKVLKPGGKLIIAVPFMVKIHQSPIDFTRYTHHALVLMGKEFGLSCILKEGLFDPLYLFEQNIGIYNWFVFPEVSRLRRLFAKVILRIIHMLVKGMEKVLGKRDLIKPVDATLNRAPVGYHFVFRKCCNT
jgi:SAM-dependent methyltransferase